LNKTQVIPEHTFLEFSNMFLARSITTPYALQRASMLAYRHRSALTSPVEATCYKLSSSDGKFVQESQFCPSSIEETIGNMRVLFLTNSFNSMAQRAYLELTDTYMTDVHIEFAIDEKQLIKSVKRVNPDVIICPFLTKRIPEAIWRNQDVPCLVMHPGIRGDRGASSIDWALKKNIPEWGVTVLQADEEMDAGAIWSTKNFQVTPDITKSGMYAHLVVDSAMECLHEVLAKVATGDQGTPLDYNDPEVKGTLRPNMKLYDRTVDFNASADNVASTIRYSDSAPGASADFDGHKVFLYNVHVDKECKSAQALSGTITGKLNGAVRIACASGSVWVTHMKGRGKDTRLPQIKLPATDVLPQSIVSDVPEVTKPDIFANLDDSPYVDVWVSIEEEVAVISFPFLNGAMSTDQCNRLTECFQETIQRPDVKVVVLAGGGSAWSNGINLNTIEAASDPADESWRNINAINDFVKAVFSAKDKVTVAALQGNAGMKSFTVI
jgi:putative two-component system hydrogenase maturation factor HypX/HoxX